MEEGIRNERFSSGARAVGRSATAPDGERFSMATKSIVLAATIATVSLVDSVRLSPALTCFLLLYLAACGQRSMAFKMLVFYAALWGACLALAYGKMTVIVFSPVHFYAAIKTYPIMVAFFAVALSPPGLISAALAKARIPKRLIVGVLVLLRFFPTVRSSFRRLSESCKRRGAFGGKRRAQPRSGARACAGSLDVLVGGQLRPPFRIRHRPRRRSADQADELLSQSFRSGGRGLPDGRRDGAGCVRLGCAGRVVRMTGDLVAQLKGASFSYYGAPETLHAVDLDVHAGECVVLMGASGSGKTTIVRVLNGLAGGYYRGSVSGDVFLGGLSARDMEAWRRAELVGSVFQDPTAQFFSSQLAGEVAFGCENIGYPAEEVVRRTDAAIGRLGLDQLSSGQKQRVAIASSLAPAPRLVVMDEPSSNLDEDAAQELGAVLMELKRQGYALVVAEHRISYLMECADRFCYMEAGRMRAVLSRDDVFAMEGSERVAMGVRSPSFVVRPSLKPAPLAARLAREGERAASGEAFGARLEAASLEVDGLSVSRGRNLLFSDVGFAVEPGQIMALTGKNGVGKTSLAQVAVGLGRPDEGCVRVGGRKLSRRELRRRVWYSPNDVSMEFFSSRVDEEVLLFSDRDDAARRYADHVLDRLGLAELGDRHPSSLSGGQKQRLSIACGLASRRSVLILDEPTSGLDALSMRRLADALRCAAEEGAAVVVITHDNEFMRECCTHAFALEGAGADEGERRAR